MLRRERERERLNNFQHITFWIACVKHVYGFFHILQRVSCHTARCANPLGRHCSVGNRKCYMHCSWLRKASSRIGAFIVPLIMKQFKLCTSFAAQFAPFEMDTRHTNQLLNISSLFFLSTYKD